MLLARAVVGGMGGLLLALLLAAPVEAAPAGGHDDRFVAGYAMAILEREFGLRGVPVRVQDGVVTVRLADVPAETRERIGAALRTVPGARRVVIATTLSSAAAEPAPRPRSAAPSGAVVAAPGAGSGAGAGAAAPVAGPAPESRGPGAGARGEVATARTLPTGVLPGGELFAPLIADPRWPQLGFLTYHVLDGGEFGERQLGNVVAPSIGETVVFYRGGTPWDLQWEIGLLAGVFPIFDLDSSSLELVNTDYLVGGFIGLRRGALSAMTRLVHQSSHLGDEFVLAGGIERVNLSFERLDVKVSWDATEWLRLYGGPGYLVRVNPALDRWSWQAGAEARGPDLWARLHPVVAADVQSHAYNDWRASLSLRAGIEWSRTSDLPAAQLLLHYFTGRALDGQFHDEALEYLGVGLQVQF